MRLLHTAYWWLRTRTHKIARLGNIDILFLGADGELSSEAILSIVKRALEEISAAKAGFGELVESHLQFVAARKVDGSFAMPEVRGFVSSFSGREGDDPLYLAARLVWASTYIRLWRDATASGRSANRDGVRTAAHEAQIRFLNRFPGSESLIAYLQRHGSPPGSISESQK
jgi:hypothetical protein